MKDYEASVLTPVMFLIMYICMRNADVHICCCIHACCSGQRWMDIVVDWTMVIQLRVCHAHPHPHMHQPWPELRWSIMQWIYQHVSVQLLYRRVQQRLGKCGRIFRNPVIITTLNPHDSFCIVVILSIVIVVNLRSFFFVFVFFFFLVL